MIDKAAAAAYSALQPGQMIGPEHHRFKLISAFPAQPPGQLWQAEDQTSSPGIPVSLLIFDPHEFVDSDQLTRLRDTLNRTRTLKGTHLLQPFGQFSYRGLLFISLPRLQGLTLAQLIRDKKLSKLAFKQRKGLLVQLGRALHTIQMGRSSHGTLCPELIYLNPGQGVQLLGTGWYNAFDPLSSALNYGRYQPEHHLQRGTSDTQGDTYALARLCVQLFHDGRPEFDTPPERLTEAQWQTLNSVLSAPQDAAIQAPMQLLRELFGDTPDADQFIETAPVETVSAAPPPVSEIPDAGTSPDSERTPLSTEAAPAAAGRWTRLASVRKALSSASLLWLTIGLVGGFLLAQLIRLPSPAPDQPRTTLAPTPPEPVARITPMVTGEDSAKALDPMTPGTRELLHANHLIIFQHQLVDGGTAPEMVRIPTGRFRMGDAQGLGDDNERPVHEVVVSKPFALGRYEVSFEQYDRFALATGRALPDDLGWGRGDRPVINVSWNDASAYTAWLAAQTGEPYRLPSEAEWEYAARAGTESAYWWGNELLPGLAQCDGCGSALPADRTAPIGRFAANPWGLFDMSGNVDEWVADCYADNYQNAANHQNPLIRSGCQARVMRGGSWFEIARLVRNASRYRHPAQAKGDSWGFRVALDMKQ